MHSPAPPQAIEPQRLSIHLKLANDDYGAGGETFQLYDVEDAIGAAIEPAGVIEGHEIGKGFFVIFVTGAHPDTLLPMIRHAFRYSVLVRAHSSHCTRADGSETRFPTPP